MRLALYQGRVEVAVCGRRERQNRELCERIREAGGRAHGYAVDLRDFRALAEFFQQIAMDHPPVACLVVRHRDCDAGGWRHSSMSAAGSMMAGTFEKL